MSDKIKSPITIFIVLILVSLSLAGVTFHLLQKEKAKSASLQQQLDDLMLKQRVTETKLEEHKKTISQLELQLKDAQTKIDALTADLENETAQKQEALGQLQQLKADLEKQKTLRSDLETKLSQIQKDVEKKQGQLKDLENKKGQLEAKIKDLETQMQQAQSQQAKAQGQEGVELGTIVVGPEGAPVEGTAQQSKSALEGKVLVVNKEYNFVVVNLGSKDGVNVDDIFSVYQSEKNIGDIKVAKVHDSMSAADFVSSSTKDQIKEGDRVVQRSK